MPQGLTMIFTGSGKGKTTAAMGTALRAVGHDMRVLMLQFIKHSRCGELIAIPRLAPQFELQRHGGGFTFRGKNNDDDPDRHRRLAAEALAMAHDALTGGGYDMLILDEVCTALSIGLLAVDDVLPLLALRPSSMHLILTGRGAPEVLIDAADLVTEMREIKHPYRKGVKAQKGVEF